GIVLGETARAQDQNDEVQYRPPKESRQTDDTPVGQKLLEKLAHGPETGGIRRAKVDEENADLSRLNLSFILREEIDCHLSICPLFEMMQRSITYKLNPPKTEPRRPAPRAVSPDCYRRPTIICEVLSFSM